MFRIKLDSCQRPSEGSDKTCAHQDPATPQRLRQNCVCVSAGEVQISSGLLQGQGLWVQQTWVWCKPSWRRRSPLTHHRAARTHTEGGKQTLGGTNRTLCTRTQEEEQWPHKRLTQTCPGVSRSLQWRRGSAVACCRVGALSAAVHDGTFWRRAPSSSLPPL